MKTWWGTNGLLVAGVVGLWVFGLVMLGSIEGRWEVGSGPSGEFPHLVARQVVWGGLGLVTMAMLAPVDHRRLSGFACPVLIYVFLLLVLVLIPGVGHNVNGARSMVEIPPVKVRPADLAMPALVLFLARCFARPNSRRTRRSASLPYDVLSGARRPRAPWLLSIAGVMIVLVAAQPAFSPALLLALTALAVLLAAREQRGLVLGVYAVALAGLFCLLLWDPARWLRLVDFYHPSSPFACRPTYAMAWERGGWTGVGLGRADTVRYYLPEAPGDFMVAVIAEELGLIGVLGVAAALGLVIAGIVRIARRSRDRFGFLLGVGVATWIGLQSLIHVGVVRHWLPIHSLPLPLVSSGGVDLWVMLASLGAVLSIARPDGSRDERSG